MRGKASESGFSLVEMLVAMVVTMLISGAIYKLMTSSETAMRREPELSARQQNIRVAMSTIHADVYGAGATMPAFAQSFTDGLDGVGPAGPTGANADELEIFTSSECPTLTVCDYNAGASVTTFEPLSSCYNFPALVMLANEDEWGVFWAEQPGGGSTGSCSGGGGGGGGGGSNGHTVFPHGRAPLIDPPGGPGFEPEIMAIISVVKYRIANDSDGVPGLWRSPVGGQPLMDGSSSWQLVARGVEDLQVRYQTSTGWSATPGTVVGSNYDTIVRNVEISLSARVTAQNLAGESASAVGTAIRGRLVSQIVPRPALLALQSGGQFQ